METQNHISWEKIKSFISALSQLNSRKDEIPFELIRGSKNVCGYKAQKNWRHWVIIHIILIKKYIYDESLLKEIDNFLTEYRNTEFNYKPTTKHDIDIANKLILKIINNLDKRITIIIQTSTNISNSLSN